jgi:hypothetical protein
MKQKQCEHHSGFYPNTGHKFCPRCEEDLERSRVRIKNIFSRIDFDKVFNDLDKKATSGEVASL